MHLGAMMFGSRGIKEDGTLFKYHFTADAEPRRFNFPIILFDEWKENGYNIFYL